MRITGFPIELMTRYAELMHEKLPNEEVDEMWQVEEREIEQTKPVMFQPDFREFAYVSSNEAQEPAVLGEQGLVDCPKIKEMF